MIKYLTEFIGTFFLVLTIGLSVLSGSSVAPLAIGAVLMVMVYMGGHVSGAHYNPAVSLALLLRGKLEAKELAPYVVSQLVGALAASAAVFLILGETFAPSPGAAVSAASAVLAETLYTFALTLVILNVATSKATEGNSYYGLAIGATVAGGAFAVGPVSGGVFNPAVGIGPIVMSTLLGDGTFANLWIYLVGPIAGAAIATVFFKFQEGIN